MADKDPSAPFSLELLRIKAWESSSMCWRSTAIMPSPHTTAQLHCLWSRSSCLAHACLCGSCPGTKLGQWTRVAPWPSRVLHGIPKSMHTKLLISSLLQALPGGSEPDFILVTCAGTAQSPDLDTFENAQFTR